MPAIEVAIAEWLHFRTLRLVHAPQLCKDVPRHNVANSSERVFEPHQLRSMFAAQDIVLESTLHFTVDVEILDYEVVALHGVKDAKSFRPRSYSSTSFQIMMLMRPNDPRSATSSSGKTSKRLLPATAPTPHGVCVSMCASRRPSSL